MYILVRASYFAVLSNCKNGKCDVTVWKTFEPNFSKSEEFFETLAYFCGNSPPLNIRAGKSVRRKVLLL